MHLRRLSGEKKLISWLSKTTVSEAAKTVVTFENQKPKIISLKVTCFIPGKYGGYNQNTICDYGGHMYSPAALNTISWQAENADRYELWNGVKFLYNGTNTQWIPPDGSYGYFYPFVLKAFKGTTMTTISVNPDAFDADPCGGYNCNGG